MPDKLWRACSGVLHTRLAVPFAITAIVLTACTAPIPDRPREGAPVGADGQPVSKADENTVPPTLSPPGAPGSSPLTLATPGSPPSGSPVGSPSPVASPSPLPVGGYVIVATDGAGANVRTGPSTSAPVITTLAEGTAVEVIGDPVTVEGRAWRQIQSGSQVGWAVDVVVRPRGTGPPPVTKPTAPTPAAPTPAAPTPAAKPAAPTPAAKPAASPAPPRP